MYLVPPYIASVVFSASLIDGRLVSTITLGGLLDFAALAVVLAGAFLVARYKAALDVTEATARAWREEREAAVSHAQRLNVELREKEAKIALLEARPDLGKMEELMEKLVDATVLHEHNAVERHAATVEAIRDVR